MVARGMSSFVFATWLVVGCVQPVDPTPPVEDPTPPVEDPTPPPSSLCEAYAPQTTAGLDWGIRWGGDTYPNATPWWKGIPSDSFDWLFKGEIVRLKHGEEDVTVDVLETPGPEAPEDYLLDLLDIRVPWDDESTPDISLAEPVYAGIVVRVFPEQLAALPQVGVELFRRVESIRRPPLFLGEWSAGGPALEEGPEHDLFQSVEAIDLGCEASVWEECSEALPALAHFVLAEGVVAEDGGGGEISLLPGETQFLRFDDTEASPPKTYRWLLRLLWAWQFAEGQDCDPALGGDAIGWYAVAVTPD